MPRAINSSTNSSIHSSNLSLVSGQHAMGTTLSALGGNNKTSFKKSGLTLDELRKKQARI